MHDPPLVRGLQSSRDLDAETQRLGRWQWTSLQPRGERFPLDELEHEMRRAGAFFESVDRRDVRVVQ